MDLWKGGSLLNPVIGLRLDTLTPRLTIGALDPNDYAGEINWVLADFGPQERRESKYVPFRIDGLKGWNGSFINFGEDVLNAGFSIGE